jgi:RHS repeat-associated protein
VNVSTKYSFKGYYAFGSPMPGRSYVSGGGAYRYGFNGQEKDDEIKGGGNSLDFGARIYDSRLGSWFSIDPFVSKYPNVSPYSFALNNPIILKDEGGKWITDVNGKPIYTSGDVKLEESKEKEGYYLIAEVRTYYTNDGKPVTAYKYTGIIKKADVETVKGQLQYDANKQEAIPEELTYDCHGNSCFPGENIYIPGTGEDGLSSADKIFKNKAEYTHVPKGEEKEGDIKIFGKNGGVNHSATLDAKGTYTTKDDRKPLRKGVDKEGTAGSWGVPLIGHKRHVGNKDGGVQSNNGEVPKEVADQAIKNVTGK